MISIHVPAWGTTTPSVMKPDGSVISIHVPAWGTTWSRFRGVDGYDDFNPRSRVGNDDVVYLVQCRQR